jgi:hypothetical protein
MRRDDIFKSKYFKATDVFEDIQLQIKAVTTEIIGEEREEKPMVYFVGKLKGLVLNLTNFNTMARICGSDETDDWVGKDVVLTTEMVTFRGQTAPAIRVRAPMQKSESRAATPAPRAVPDGWRGVIGGDEIPF